MSISALFLFGSRARGDHSHGSDIDLLAVSNVLEPTVTRMGPVTLYHYSADWLNSRAEQGDLFVWHIISEALALSDPEDFISDLRGVFKFSSSYDDKILMASDVGWAIVSLWGQLNSVLVNRRLAWCVRTIAIARSAELGVPAFSAHALADVLECPQLISLVEQKGKSEISKKSMRDFEAFLEDFGFAHRGGRLRTFDDYFSYLHKTGNQVGLNLFKMPFQNIAYH